MRWCVILGACGVSSTPGLCHPVMSVVTGSPACAGDDEWVSIAPQFRHAPSDRRGAGRVGGRARGSNAAVLVAPPGAGKTTRVPLALLDAPWAKARNHHAGAAADRGPRQCRAHGKDAGRARRRDRRLPGPVRLESVARDADRGRHRRYFLAADSRRSRTVGRRRGAVRRVSRAFARCRSGPGAGA